MALIARVWPDWVFPATIGIVSAFAVFTAWGALVKKVEDCGCYGKLITLSPAKSIALDRLYAVLAAAAWQLPLAFRLTKPGRAAVVAASAALFGFAATFSHNYYIKSRKKFWDINPLNVNRRLNSAWLEGYENITAESEQIVAPMSPNCPSCMQWIKPLNKIC